MKNVKIEFRCTEEEKKRAYDMAERHGQSVKDLMLGGTIYKRGRSGVNAREKAPIQRMMTSLKRKRTRWWRNASPGMRQCSAFTGVRTTCISILR